ncbi:MAG: PatB family C-S lyase [Syntrophorhabdales bacterium]|jgi:cystathionine beta-lyase
MRYDFDRSVGRRGTDSVKWQKYGDHVIPLWVADMDFVSAEPIIEALHRRVDEGMFGYAEPARDLPTIIQERLRRLYGWGVGRQDIIFLPGVVTGLNLAFRLYTEPGDGVLVQPPVYSHFITDPAAHGRVLNDPPLVRKDDTYEIDFGAFEKSITGRTRLFLLCNPHNPVGRVYTQSELERLAEICLRHHIVICSDEIHCDLLYPGHRHIPIASLGNDVARQTITLMAPSKTYNLAGLGCAFAVIEDPALRRIWTTGSQGLIPHVNIMGLAAALSAYRDGQEWLDQVLSYLKDNRDYLARYVRENLPGIEMTKIEATYLAWLDCAGAAIPGDPFSYFLREAGVALNSGIEYGKGGESFVRLNFGCPRATLVEALNRMADALKRPHPSPRGPRHMPG